MLSKKHFIEFADLLVELDNFEKPYKNTLKLAIDTLNELIRDKSYNIHGLHLLKDQISNCKPDLYNQLTSEIMLVLDKNSLRFNKYQFKNYIISHVEKKQLNNVENSARNN